jgi:hypothetical protein
VEAEHLAGPLADDHRAANPAGVLPVEQAFVLLDPVQPLDLLPGLPVAGVARRVAQRARRPAEKKFDEPEITTAAALGKTIVGWVERHKAKVQKAYAEIKSFPLNNERLAALLRPLQAVLKVDADNGGSPLALNMLGSWGHRMDEASSGPEKQSMGTRLLHACQEIFQEKNKPFLATATLLKELADRDDEPWAEYSGNRRISPHALRDLLEPYGIKPERQGSPVKERGYTRAKIEAACSRYC